MHTSEFRDRLAYVRWLRGRGRPRLETDEEFSQALGLSNAWVVKWKNSPTAPNSRDTARAIDSSKAAVGLTSIWLFDGEGAPPEPDRWSEWVAARTPRLLSSREVLDQVARDPSLLASTDVVESVERNAARSRSAPAKRKRRN